MSGKSDHSWYDMRKPPSNEIEAAVRLTADFVRSFLWPYFAPATIIRALLNVVQQCAISCDLDQSKFKAALRRTADGYEQAKREVRLANSRCGGSA